jgi:hypothetical protein
MFVSFDAQYQFILAQKGVLGASLIEAAMLDAGMVICPRSASGWRRRASRPGVSGS